MRQALILAAAAAAIMAGPANAATPVKQSKGKALILVPLTLVKVEDLNFGSVVPSTTVPTVVTVNAVSGNRSQAGGATLIPSDPGNAAQFAGAGTPGQLVIITTNAPLTLQNSAGDTIDVLGLTLDGPAIRTINSSRAFFVNIGGSIMMAPNQAEGTYQGDFDVTATYQ